MASAPGDWQPSAPFEVLRARAHLLAAIRAFFDRAGVLEVDTPALSTHTGTDPALEPLSTRLGGGNRFLHTSPEFPMKRLLAAGSGDIYQICKVFRDGERGRLHNPEFTLLEWYRLGFDHHRLMDEVESLARQLLGDAAGDGSAQRLSYAEAFQQHLAIDPHRASREELRGCALDMGIAGAAELDLPGRDAWLDLLLSHRIEPELGRGRMTFLYDYPASQAALARLRPGDPPLAERFELYMAGIEIANGFHELADAAEQRRRFEADQAQRRAHGRAELPVDEYLLAALEQGLPECAGVALGIDRLLMIATHARSIDQVLAFPAERA